MVRGFKPQGPVVLQHGFQPAAAAAVTWAPSRAHEAAAAAVAAAVVRFGVMVRAGLLLAVVAGHLYLKANT